MDNEKETKKHEVGDLLTCRNSTLLPSISLNMLSSLKRSNTKLRVVDRGKEQTNRLYFTQNALNSLIANASNTREHFVIYNNIVDTMNQIKKQFSTAKFFSITLEISKFMINLHCDFQNYNDAFTELLALRENIFVAQAYEWLLYLYRTLAKVLRGLKNYETALQYLKKILIYSWGSKNSKLEGDILDEMGMINYYMGNIEEAYKFHILSLYANHKLFESDLPVNYEKFKYDIWLEIEKKIEPRKTKKVATSTITYKDIPKTPTNVPKIYSNFSKDNINPYYTLTYENSTQSEIKRATMKSEL